ncbi:MAG: DnaD domain protein [Oscillospiraceae bacterium]
MEEKRWVLEESRALVLERQTVDLLIKGGNGDAALLYLYLLREGGLLVPQKAAGALGQTPDGIRQSIRALEGLGLVRPGADGAGTGKKSAPKQEEAPPAPAYTSEEIAKELECDSPFPALVQETQRRLGRVLTTADLKILFGLYDYLNLPAEVISLLITYCAEENARQTGNSAKRPLRMRQAEREAYRWKRQGVDTLDKAVEHLKHLSLRREAYGEIFQVLQLEARAPSPSEQTYLDGFLDMGFPLESIALAYDKTMLQTGSLKWPYLSSILKRWHQKNLHTLEEIRAGDGAEPPKQPAKGQAASPKETQREQEAIEWMKELVRRQKRDE